MSSRPLCLRWSSALPNCRPGLSALWFIGSSFGDKAAALGGGSSYGHGPWWLSSLKEESSITKYSIPGLVFRGHQLWLPSPLSSYHRQGGDRWWGKTSPWFQWTHLYTGREVVFIVGSSPVEATAYDDIMYKAHVSQLRCLSVVILEYRMSLKSGCSTCSYFSHHTEKT